MGDSAMEVEQSPEASLQDEGDDLQWQQQGETGENAGNDADPAGDADNDPSQKPIIPLQKRRRVTRACDECRRKKIKCDGKQPCTHCTVYSYECTYDQPSNRRRNPAPQYIEALEARLQKAEALLRAVLPNVDLDDPKFEARGIDQIIAMSRRNSPSTAPSSEKPKSSDDQDEAQLESMVQSTGTIDLDDNGNWDYHGHSSGWLFLRKLRARMGDTLADPRQFPLGRRPNIPSMMDSSRSASESPLDSQLPGALDLPPKDVAKALCRNALDDCCALLRFVHQPTFYSKFEKIYNTDPERYTNTETKFLPLLYMVMAVGCMFSSADDNRLDVEGYEKGIGQGYQYFSAGRQMIDITDCRDLTCLQTMVFMILFLQASAKLSTCYSYIGIALRACLRLGLHRNVPGDFDFIEQEQRKRIFWVLRNMDSYVGIMLGLPQMLGEDDYDQVLPQEVDDDRITAGEILPQPPGKFPLIRAANAHTRLVAILRKVTKYVYPIKMNDSSVQGKADNRYMISHSKIRELESDLQAWMDELPMDLRPSDDAPQELIRVQQLLRMSYAYVQMVIYRPFLHYSSSNAHDRNIDKRTFACAAACVSVTRNIVHITSEMKRRGLLVGAYWFVMYTTYFSIVSLVYFCLENPRSNIAGPEILKDAMEGRDTLASLARRSLAADRCSTSLESLFKDLPQRLQERKNSSKSTAATQAKKRSLPKSTAEAAPVQSNASSPSVPTVGDPVAGPQRARTFPHETQATSKRFSNPDSMRNTPVSSDSSSIRRGPASRSLATDSGTLTPDSMHSGNERVQASPQQSKFDPQHGNMNLPDLRNVMFPSNNPFAYPNQPISTLEDTQFSPNDQGNFSNFYMSNNMAQPNMSYENLSSPVFGSFPPFMTQSQPPVTGGTSAPFQNLPGTPGVGGMQPNSNFDPNSHNDEFWSQMGGNRSGLTSGVNLDELFGSESWNPMWDSAAAPTSSSFQ